MRLQKANALLLLLALPACADPSTQLPGTTKLLDELPVVENSPKSPCWQQRQIAAQNSYRATIKTGTDTVYKAPCDIEPQRVASSKS